MDSFCRQTQRSAVLRGLGISFRDLRIPELALDSLLEEA